MASFGVEDVLGGPPTWSTLLRRGLARRCPRCGGNGIFESRYLLAERCPTCGFRFVREPGFRLGAWFLNYLFISIIYWGAVMIWIIWRANHAGGSLLWPLVIAAIPGITIPIVTYPWSLTMWSAVDLGMTPLELREIVDAHDAVTDAEDAEDGDELSPPTGQ